MHGFGPALMQRVRLCTAHCAEIVLPAHISAALLEAFQRDADIGLRHRVQVLSSDIDLLHPPVELEKAKNKRKRLVQSPNSFFMDVKCQGCFQMCGSAPTHLSPAHACVSTGLGLHAVPHSAVSGLPAAPYMSAATLPAVITRPYHCGPAQNQFDAVCNRVASLVTAAPHRTGSLPLT